MKYDAAIKELSELIGRATQFADCDYERAECKKWRYDILAWIRRHYKGGECNQKVHDFESIQFISLGWNKVLTTYTADPEITGLGYAVAMMMSWKEDLVRRAPLEKWTKVKKILLGVLTALGIAGGGLAVYIKISNNSTSVRVNQKLSRSESSAQTIHVEKAENVIVGEGLIKQKK